MGTYQAKKVQVRKQVTFPTPYILPPSVWGQKTSYGYSPQRFHLNEGFCEPVPSTITNTGCTLRTFVYEVYTIAGEYVGWIPTNPGNQVFDYTVLGIEDINPPDVEVFNPNGGEEYHSLDEVEIRWRVIDEYPEGTLSDIYLVEEIGGTTNIYYIAENQPVYISGLGMYTWHIPAGSFTIETNKIRVVTKDTNDHVGLDESNNYFTIHYRSKPGDPPPEPQGVEIITNEIAQLKYFLKNPSPNPFNPLTVIEFGVEDKVNVSLNIYDVAGSLIRTFYDNELLAPDKYAVEWDGTTNSGNVVPSGIYFISFRAGGYSNTAKAVLLR
jgi:hypothetical protein